MTVSTQTPARHATRLTLALAAIAGLILSLFYVVSPTFAEHATAGPAVTPTLVEGNPTCPSGTTEVKITPPATSSGNVTLVNMNVAAGTTDFTITGGQLAAYVYMKGGNVGAHQYDYHLLAGGGVAHDDGLVTPKNPSGAPAEISHVTFCLVAGPPPPPPPPPPPEGTQLGGTGTPAASLPNTAIGLPGSGSLATIFFGAILIASLGALAYANVTAVRRRR